MIHFTPLISTKLEQVLVFDEYYQIYPPRKQQLERAIHDGAAYVIEVDGTIV